MAIKNNPTKQGIDLPVTACLKASLLSYSDLTLRYLPIWNLAVGRQLGMTKAAIAAWKNQRSSGNSTPVQVVEVYQRVINDFGGGHRFIWPRVGPSINADPVNAEDVLDKISALTAGTPVLAQVIRFFGTLRISGLGKISYPSKILRCFSEEFVILDSKVENCFGYGRSSHDYWSFLSECQSIRDSINTAPPDAGLPRVTTAEVESGLFAFLGGGYTARYQSVGNCR
jgi:hypothetical protein